MPRPKYTKDKLIKAFWSKVNKQGPYPDPKKYPKLKTRCWLWLGAKTKHNYGYFVTQGKAIRAHRFAWTLSKGKIPKDLFVCHKCDNEACVRHLFLGTHQDNADDMCSKGRQAKGLYLKSKMPSYAGEKNGRAILTNIQVYKLRKLYIAGKYLQRELAVLFNVSTCSVRDAISRKTFSSL